MDSLLKELLKRYLFEGYQQSTIRRSKQDKIKSSTGSIAINMGRKNEDPLYVQMLIRKAMYIKLKKQLERKYKSKSLQRARFLASKSK
jgi:hypothetical protein